MEIRAGCCKIIPDEASTASTLLLAQMIWLALFAFWFFIHAGSKQTHPAPLYIIYSGLDQRNSLQGWFGHYYDFFFCFFPYFINIYLFSLPFPILPVAFAHKQIINYSPACIRQVFLRPGNQISPSSDVGWERCVFWGVCGMQG